MTALPLLLALALTADAPAAPAAEPADDEAGPQTVVAPPDAPGDQPAAAPAAPFALTGFMPAEQVVVGVAARIGGSSLGLDGGLEATARWHGAVLGATVGGARALGDDGDPEGVNTLGLVVGYGLARGRYRGEVLLGWGVGADLVDVGGGTTSVDGNFRSAQLGLDRAVAGGQAWRASLGLGLWWREIYSLPGTPSSHSEVGGGLRLGIEAGL